MNRDEQRIEEEIAGARRPDRPAALSGEYLRQAMDALWFLGTARHLHAVKEEPPDPAVGAFFDAAATRRRYSLACNAVLFSAFAAEAYVNEFLAAHLSGSDLEAVDKMATIDKYILGTRLAYGERLFFRDREPYSDLLKLFKQRNRLVHARPGTGPAHGVAAVELEDGLKPPQLARYLVAVAGSADVLIPRAYGFHSRDVLPHTLWMGRRAIYDFGKQAKKIPKPGTPDGEYILHLATKAMPGPLGFEPEWSQRLRKTREAAASTDQAAKQRSPDDRTPDASA